MVGMFRPQIYGYILSQAEELFLSSANYGMRFGPTEPRSRGRLQRQRLERALTVQLRLQQSLLCSVTHLHRSESSLSLLPSPSQHLGEHQEQGDARRCFHWHKFRRRHDPRVCAVPMSQRSLRSHLSTSALKIICSGPKGHVNILYSLPIFCLLKLASLLRAVPLCLSHPPLLFKKTLSSCTLYLVPSSLQCRNLPEPTDPRLP
jgi:hypothetical protein